jgi:hypothetical protein
MNPILNPSGIVDMHSSSKDIVNNTVITLRNLLSTSNNDVDIARKELLASNVLPMLQRLLRDCNEDNNPSNYSIQKYTVWIIKLLLEGDGKRFITSTSKKIGEVLILNIFLKHIYYKTHTHTSYKGRYYTRNFTSFSTSFENFQ